MYNTYGRCVLMDVLPRLRIVVSLPLLLVLVIFTLVHSVFGVSPPREPPSSLLQSFTLNYTVELQLYYVDDSNQGKGTHYKYSLTDIEQLLQQAKIFIKNTLSLPPPFPPHTISHTTWRTQLSDIWLVHALHHHPVTGHHVVVFGSTHPWYESLLLEMGVAHITVVEYNQLTYSHPNITTITPSLLELSPQFDTAMSLSSFDHDGLGRYGDPINPVGDLVAMDTVKQVLKDRGLLFLTVPIGPDVLVWNLHRRYGPERLPLLLQDWEQVEVVGWQEDLLHSHAPFTLQYEPVFVLSPLASCAITDHGCD